MNFILQKRLHRFLLFGTAVAVFGLTSVAVRAQDDDFRISEPIPAPMRFIAAPQKAQLDSAADPKKRTQLSLLLAQGRLDQAEALTLQQDFVGAAMELGNYQGLIHDTIGYLQTLPQKGNTARDLFKQLEIALRSHCPRLEGLRRNTPQVYAANIKDVIHFTEDSRDTSLSCFFGQTVLREKDGTTPNETPKQKPLS